VSPIAHDILYGDRFMGRVNIVKQEKPSHLETLKKYVSHIHLKFFFFKGDSNKRHHHGFLGMLNILLLPFFVMGLYYLGREAWSRGDPFWVLIFAMILVAFIPASLTDDGIPHSGRSMAAALPLLALCAGGFFAFQSSSIFSAYSSSLSKFVTLSLVLNLVTIGWFFSVFPKRAAGYYYSHQVIQDQILNRAHIPPMDKSAETLWGRIERVKEGATEFCSNPHN